MALDGMKELVGLDSERTKSEKMKILAVVDSVSTKNTELRNAIWNLKPAALDKLKPKFEEFKNQMDKNSQAYPDQVASFKEDFMKNMEIYALPHKEIKHTEPNLVAKQTVKQKGDLENGATAANGGYFERFKNID